MDASAKQYLIPKSVYAKDGNFYMVVHAKPNSKESQISGISDDAVDINISAPPKDGEANNELIEMLSQALQIKKSHINLQRGSKARDKLVEVKGTQFASLLDFYKAILAAVTK